MTSSLIDTLSDIRELQKSASTEYEQQADDWWNALSLEQRELAFYSVIKRVYQGEIVEQGSYRYILYEIFGFDAGMYGRGMDCGFMSLHNSIMSEKEQQALHEYYESKKL